MNQAWIDTFTRSFAAANGNRAVWRAVTGTAAAGLWALLRRNTAPALAEDTANCMMLNFDATCPPGTNKQPKPGNTPSWNGCGPEGGSIKIPQGYGSADYTSSCNGHDVCYEECGTPKATCDDVFLEDMYDSCAAAYPGVLKALLRMGCYERAYVYYQAVATFGDDAWLAGQKKACECCSEPQTVYCNCNKTCYDDVNVCLSECKTGLGCFTGICGPASAEQCPGV